MSTEHRSRPVVAVFARAPTLGVVKTRLAASVGADVALAVHRALLDRTLRTVAAVAEVDAELWLDGPPEHVDELGLPVFAQGDGDLGIRMLAVIADIVKRGHPAIIVGGDCPVLDGDYVRAAADALVQGADVVIGPVEDGGYILIGMREPIPALLLDMTWSTQTVYAETLSRAKALRLSVTALAMLWDIDDAADLHRWRVLMGEAWPG